MKIPNNFHIPIILISILIAVVSNFGAIIYFVGTVRDLNENKKVTGITYDSHDAMVIKSFEEIYNDVDQKLKIKE